MYIQVCVYIHTHIIISFLSKAKQNTFLRGKIFLNPYHWLFYQLRKHLCPQHETVRNEMNSKQKELDSFTSKGKHLLSELKKIHSGDFGLVKTDMESTLDKWLDVRAPPGVCEQLICRIFQAEINLRLELHLEFSEFMPTENVI